MSSIFATGTTGTIGKHFGGRISKIGIDFTNPAPIKISYIKSGDIVLHAAAVVGSANVNKDRSLAHFINVKGSAKLAKFVKNLGIARFVYVSTSHVYSNSDLLLTESSITSPDDIYAEQKLEAEQEITRIFRDTPESLCIVRVFSVLDWDTADFTLGGGIKKLISPQSDFVLNNSDDTRDFLTPRQIANFLIDIANQHSLAGIVNLSSGTGTTVRDAAHKMIKISGYKFPEDRVTRGNSNKPYIVGDNHKLKSYLPNLDLVWSPSPWVRN